MQLHIVEVAVEGINLKPVLHILLKFVEADAQKPMLLSILLECFFLEH